MAGLQWGRFPPRSDAAAWTSPLVAGIIPLLVYVRTLAPDLTWAHHGADGGELITAAVTLGVPHPPGYPTYVLLGHLFGQLPLGTIAYRYNLFSALSMAVAIIFLAAAAYRLAAANKAIAAVVAAMTFAFLPFPWQQALIAEVYGLNMAVIAVLLLALLSGWSLPAIGVLFGLALTTHPTSILLAPAVLSTIKRWQWPRLIAASVLGLSPFLVLPFLARSGSPIVWGEPDQLKGWWWLVTAALYRPNLFGVPTEELTNRMKDWFWSGQLALPLLLLIVALVAFRWRKWPLPQQASALGITASLYLLVSFTYGPSGSAVLLLPGLACVMLLVVPFLGRLGGAALVLPTVLLLINFSRLDLGADREARSLGQRLLDETPQAAILLTEGDATTFTLWYLHEVEERRPDITIVDRNLFGFDWYRQQLSRRNQWLPSLPEYDLDLLSNLSRPLCTARLEPCAMTINCRSGENLASRIR